MRPHQHIFQLRKEGQVEEAYRQAKEYLQLESYSMLKNSFGWVLYDQLKALIGKSKEVSQEEYKREIENFLSEYKKMKIPCPTLLFSCILGQLLRLNANDVYLSDLIDSVGLNCFQPEDFKQQKQGEKTYESLVEKAARKMAKVSQGSGEKQLRLAISLLDIAAEKAEVKDMTWLQYYKALLLAELGLHKEARELMVKVAKKKRGDFWAWQALGQLEEDLNPEKALALYARAILVCQQPRFAVNTYEGLCRAALKQKRTSLAKWSATQAFRIRQKNQWNLPQSLRDLVEAQWYRSAEEESHPNAVLENLATVADSYLYADLPRYPGTLMGTFTSAKNKLMVKVVCKLNTSIEEVVNPVRGLPVGQLRMGDPVRVAIFEEENRMSIVEIKVRDLGFPFDCLQSHFGVISIQNTNSERASVYVSDDIFFLLPYKEFPHAQGWALGTSVIIRFQEYKGRLRAYAAQETEFKETKYIRRVKGKVSQKPQGFAFLDDIFIPPHMARGYEDGEEAGFVAVRKRDPKKDVMGWRAISPWK